MFSVPNCALTTPVALIVCFEIGYRHFLWNRPCGVSENWKQQRYEIMTFFKILLCSGSWKNLWSFQSFHSSLRSSLQIQCIKLNILFSCAVFECSLQQMVTIFCSFRINLLLPVWCSRHAWVYILYYRINCDNNRVTTVNVFAVYISFNTSC